MESCERRHWYVVSWFKDNCFGSEYVGCKKKKITLATIHKVKSEEKVTLGVSYLGYMTQTEFKGE